MGGVASVAPSGGQALPECGGEQPDCTGGRLAASPLLQEPRTGLDVGFGVALPDAHFHLGFVADAAAFAAEAQKAEGLLFAASVSPDEYRETKAWLVGAACSCAKLAVGLHPWWVPKADEALSHQLAAFDTVLPETRFVGEVGLDFSKRRVHTRDVQLKAFRHIAHACAEAGGKALSLHCVGAYEEALWVLRETGCLESCTCVFHWFSGSFPQLAQAIDAGCFFSVGARMLATKRGREYAKAIPLQRILLETDAPAANDPERSHPSVAYTYAQQQEELQCALVRLAQLRKAEALPLAEAILRNAKAVM